jgi:RNA polymerase sigma-70 factor (ECF subfamily)
MSLTVTRSESGQSLTPEFEEIFREHYQLVYRAAYGVTGNRQDAEDVLQTIFVRLIQREIPPDLWKNPKGYLYRAAVNLSLNVVRSRKRQSLTGDVEQLEAQAPASRSTEEDEIRRNLRDAVARLKPKAVEMLILRYAENYSDAEIAKLLGKSRGTIAVTLYRARARLKKALLRAFPRKG